MFQVPGSVIAVGLKFLIHERLILFFISSLLSRLNSERRRIRTLRSSLGSSVSSSTTSRGPTLKWYEAQGAYWYPVILQLCLWNKPNWSYTLCQSSGRLKGRFTQKWNSGPPRADGQWGLFLVLKTFVELHSLTAFTALQLVRHNLNLQNSQYPKLIRNNGIYTLCAQSSLFNHFTLMPLA